MITPARAVRELRRDIAQLATSFFTVDDRAAAILRRLGETVPFDAGWLALRDAEQQHHVPLATTGAAAPLHDYFARPDADGEVERLGLNGPRPPMLATEMPIPLSEVAAWADHLLPAGLRHGLAVGLFTADGRHVGFLGLLSAEASRPNRADRSLIAAVTNLIAENVDRTRDIAATARIVGEATAGVVLTRGGDVLALPGLFGDRLLAPGSAVLTVAAHEVGAGRSFTSYLCPVPGVAERLIRVTALDLSRPGLDHLSAAVLMSPATDLRGLTLDELHLLGLLVEGVTDVQALAHALHLPSRTTAAALERSLLALGTADPAVAAVRALRRGLRIPPAVAAT